MLIAFSWWITYLSLFRKMRCKASFPYNSKQRHLEHNKIIHHSFSIHQLWKRTPWPHLIFSKLFLQTLFLNLHLCQFNTNLVLKFYATIQKWKCKESKTQSIRYFIDWANAYSYVLNFLMAVSLKACSLAF